MLAQSEGMEPQNFFQLAHGQPPALRGRLVVVAVGDLVQDVAHDFP
jgi:hypothetical protein